MTTDKTTRYYGIRDAYRVLFKGEDLATFIEALSTLAQGMSMSNKDDLYMIFTDDISPKDFEIEQRNRALAKERRKNKLFLVSLTDD